MKNKLYKFIQLLMVIFLLSCSDSKVYTLHYKVYYSDNNVKEYKISSNKGYYWSSDRGSNYIKEGSLTGPTVIYTSAPIEIISYTSKKIK